MTAYISWSTIGKSDPLIRGNPSEFDSVASAFDSIKKHTSVLKDELSELRAGEAGVFQGEAANAFYNRIKALSTALADVPIVASCISGVFRSHSRDLSALRKEAGAALARAETGWNKKRHAESDISSCESRLRSISRQLSALSGDDSPGAASARSRLRSRQSSVRHERGEARRRLDDANDRLDESRSEWNSLRKDEDALNEQTSKSLLSLQLRSLKDPGRLSKLGGKVAGVVVDITDGIVAVWESIETEFLENIYQFLSDILEIMDWAGLVLEFVPVVGQIYKVIEMVLVGAKAAVGLVLVLKGAMSMVTWQAETALDVVGMIPGLPKAAIKGLVKVGRKGSKALLEGAGSKRLTSVAKSVGTGIEHTATRASKKINSMGKRASKTVVGFMDRQAEASSRRRKFWSFRMYQARHPGHGSELRWLDFENRPRIYDPTKPIAERLGGRSAPFSLHYFDASNRASVNAIVARRRIRDMGQNYAADLRELDSIMLDRMVPGMGHATGMGHIKGPDDHTVTMIDRSLDERSVPVKDGRQPVLEPCGF